MRLVTYVAGDSAPRLGALIDGDSGVLDLERAHLGLGRGSHEALSTMQGLIESGEAAWAVARKLVAQADRSARLERSSVKLLAPLPRPEQIRDFVCFEEHLVRSFDAAIKIEAAAAPDPATREREIRASGKYTVPQIWYRQPLYYKGNRFATVGTDVDVEWPPFSTVMDYELEFAAVIGQRAKNVRREEAAAYIFGYTVFNDLSARDAQLREMQGNLGPAKGKDFDGANVFGPCIVTADEIGDPYALAMVARVNGEEWSRGHSSTMHWRFEDLIAHVSQSETLYPGEILGSGTVGGGCGAELMRFLAPGDVIELEVERIGTIRNRILAPGKS